jgi:hypothetical protein
MAVKPLEVCFWETYGNRRSYAQVCCSEEMCCVSTRLLVISAALLLVDAVKHADFLIHSFNT